MRIEVTSLVEESPRVLQLRGIFDLTAEKVSKVSWELPDALLTVTKNTPDSQPWNVGLIVGPSGCGKSTIAKHLFPELLGATPLPWSTISSVVDDFPENLSIKDITALLSSVGFSSPPAWLRPFHVLSTGQQFRVTLARLLAESPTLAVMDEFTSVVDRTVAQVGSAALAKTVRARNQKFVAVTCHEDVEEWLQPDWVYRPAEGTFTRRLLRRRPSLYLQVFRCKSEAWPLFAPHHYLSDNMNPAAWCFLATWQEKPVAFSAWLPFVGPGPKARREHRTVTLPDYQGVGIGNALSDCIASLWAGLGLRATSTTTHPAMIASRQRSPNWRMHRAPSMLQTVNDKIKHATTRITAGFEYIGPPMKPSIARSLLNL